MRPLVHIALTFDGEGNQTERFLHGLQIDQVLAQENAGGEVLWALGDHQGSVRMLLDNDGNVVNNITYDAFGNITVESNPEVNFRFSYTGRELDEETGQYYYRARYFDPTVGQFISEDPIGFNAGDSSLVRYVGNSPINYTDPSGLRSLARPAPRPVRRNFRNPRFVPRPNTGGKIPGTSSPQFNQINTPQKPIFHSPVNGQDPGIIFEEINKPRVTTPIVPSCLTTPGGSCQPKDHLNPLQLDQDNGKGDFFRQNPDQSNDGFFGRILDRIQDALDRNEDNAERDNDQDVPGASCSIGDAGKHLSDPQASQNSDNDDSSDGGNGSQDANDNSSAADTNASQNSNFDIEDIVNSSLLPSGKGSETTRGLQGLQKRLDGKKGKPDPAFAEFSKTQEDVNFIIRETLSAENKIVTPPKLDRNKDEVINIFNPSTRRGVRLKDGKFHTFVNLDRTDQ